MEKLSIVSDKGLNEKAYNKLTKDIISLLTDFKIPLIRKLQRFEPVSYPNYLEDSAISGGHILDGGEYPLEFVSEFGVSWFPDFEVEFNHRANLHGANDVEDEGSYLTKYRSINLAKVQIVKEFKSRFEPFFKRKKWVSYQIDPVFQAVYDEYTPGVVENLKISLNLTIVEG